MHKMCFPGPVALLALFSVATAQAQEPPQSQSVVEAARSARERKQTSVKPPKIITNADLGTQVSSSTSNGALAVAPSTPADSASSAPQACDNSQALRLAADLQAAQEQLDALRRDLDYQAPAISGNNLDLQQFRPGSSGFTVGTPPLLDSEPAAPARATAVELQETVASLTKALRIACAPPQAARVQAELDSAEHHLDLLQRQFALDRDAFYTKPDFAQDVTGKASLDQEQQQIQDLQAQIDTLRQQLAAASPPEISPS